MSDSLSLPLRPLIEESDRPDALPVEIAQINAQWGAFRDVNEDSLRAQIEQEKYKDPYADDDDENDEDTSATDVDSAERLDLLYRRRAEITQFALQAHMEAMFALDFVSLLLSKQQPRQAETSMSAFLKQTAPLGSLDAEVVHPPPKPESAAVDTKTVSRGWRLQNFNAGANRLLDAATRLETEVASETRYWNEVLAVKEKGWKVCRLPRDRQALGVQYGFMEATPIFRDRGLAALRRADDGSLMLDKGLAPQRARMVRVRVKSCKGISGCSRVHPSSTNNAESIEDRIFQARDTLYEEELFHELFREARILGNQGVTTRQNLLQVPVSSGQEILLDLVDMDGDPTPDDPEIASTEDDTLANAISHSIHILLAYAHRQNLRRRTQPPPPLVPKRRHTPEYQLLRPVMAYLQHSSHVRWLESFLGDLHQVLKAAGLQFELNASPFSSLRLPTTPSIPAAEALVQTFLIPFESTFSCKLPSAQGSFKVRVRTSAMSPPLGTHFDISVNIPEYPDSQPPNRIGLQEEAAEVLTHFTMLDILSAIAHNSSPSAWTAVYPHHGELMAISPTGQNKKLQVTLSRHEISVRASSARGFEHPAEATDKKPVRSQTWKPNTPTESLSLMDFVAEISKDDS
ncbi:RNA polymerase II mediator complex subunit [Aspergillus nanangensis]|uniref:Mediator of RNA polymerase II transcription subunit 17 n=1 Tax=Aspergillus nanangensis TaxID=2582783 RepID=A0AAD4CPT5_ASPNN|nr:RNA polymerase II mediator complex subunit [Aspergillus nanangensis]